MVKCFERLWVRGEIRNLLNDYRKFERLANNYDGSGVLNTSSTHFSAPTTLIPFLCFINDNDILFSIFFYTSSFKYTNCI